MIDSDDGMRLAPAMPAHAYQTFQISMPLETHWRAATCVEVNCEQYLHGWRVRLDPLSEEDRWAIHRSGRRYVRQDVAEGETWLLFEPGQACFAASEHRTPIGKPELFIVKGGDWRGNPRGEVRQHKYAEDWVDQFANHQDRVARAIQEG